MTLIQDVDLDATRDSHARKLFLQDRRPELYGSWLSRHRTQDPPEEESTS